MNWEIPEINGDIQWLKAEARQVQIRNQVEHCNSEGDVTLGEKMPEEVMDSTCFGTFSSRMDTSWEDELFSNRIFTEGQCKTGKAGEN